jgi:hypothetical protein
MTAALSVLQGKERAFGSTVLMFGFMFGFGADGAYTALWALRKICKLHFPLSVVLNR